MTQAQTPTAPAVTLKTATFDDVEVFKAAARSIGNAKNRAKDLTGGLVGALFRLCAGMTPADAGAKVEALYNKVYEDLPKATAGGASSYRAIFKVFKDMGAAGLTIPLPVYESVKSAKEAYEAHVNGLPATVEAREKAEAQAAEEAQLAADAAARQQAEAQEMAAIIAEARRIFKMQDAPLSDLLAEMSKTDADETVESIVLTA
jgi:hypothetical protein